MRREILATLLISIFWIVAGIAVAYSTWHMMIRSQYPAFYPDPLPDPGLLGVVLSGAALFLTFVIIRTMLPSRATRRRKLMRLLDEVGIEDVDVIQRKLSAITNEYDADDLERAVSLESLIHEPKRKNRAE